MGSMDRDFGGTGNLGAWTMDFGGTVNNKQETINMIKFKTDQTNGVFTLLTYGMLMGTIHADEIDELEPESINNKQGMVNIGPRSIVWAGIPLQELEKVIQGIKAILPEPEPETVAMFVDEAPEELKRLVEDVETKCGGKYRNKKEVMDLYGLSRSAYTRVYMKCTTDKGREFFRPDTKRNKSRVWDEMKNTDPVQSFLNDR